MPHGRIAERLNVITVNNNIYSKAFKIPATLVSCLSCPFVRFKCAQADAFALDNVNVHKQPSTGNEFAELEQLYSGNEVSGLAAFKWDWTFIWTPTRQNLSSGFPTKRC